MPCRDEGRVEYELQDKVNSLTQMLCWIMRRVDAEDRDWLDAALKYNHHLKAWWLNHKRADEERRQAQMAEIEAHRVRQQAISKLTDAERAALGLNR